MGRRATDTRRRTMPLEAHVTPFGAKVDAGADALAIDADGRWTRVRLGGRRLLRAVDGTVWRADPASRPTRVDAGEVDRAARALAADLRSRLERADAVRLSGPFPSRGWLSMLLERVRYGPDAETLAMRFAAAYREAPPVLPPDRYHDVYLALTTGCPHARCAFCRLFRAPFRVLGPAEFARHLERVVRLFGRSLPRRGGVFLGGANALGVRNETLLDALRRVRAMWRSIPRGIGAFADPDHSPRRSPNLFREFAALGLRRICCGLESGDPETRRALGKSGDLKAFARFVEAAKSGGTGVAVTLLAGPFRGRHEQATAEFVHSLPLDHGDLVYVSPLDGLPRWEAPAARLRARLQEVTPARVAPYRVDRFAYLL